MRLRAPLPLLAAACSPGYAQPEAILGDWRPEQVTAELLEPGVGLDDRERYRNLPVVGILKRSALD